MNVPPPNIDLAFAAVIKRLREKQDISQETLARRADMSTSSYGKIERAEAGPAWVTFKQIARGLGTTPAALAKLVEAEGS